MIHSVSRKFYLSSGGYREHLVGNYVIIYRIEGSLVILCRLFLSKTELSAICY